MYLGIFLVVVYAGFGLVLLLMQSRLLYRPVRNFPFTPPDLDLDFEDVAFHSTDGVALHGWFVPARQARFTVLFCHGNSGNIAHRLDSINLLHDLGLDCFVFDYRGYGKSQGKPTEAGTYQDARAAYDWLTQIRGLPPEQIVVLGRSLGGSVAAHLAGNVSVAGLVIESAFTSYPDIGAKFYPYMPVRLFALYRYDTRAHLARVRCPVLMMHSPDDDLVPFEFGQELFQVANEPKHFVELIGGHNDAFLVAGDLYKDAWLRWLDFVADYQAGESVHRAS
ncbi:MAG: alpha/beta hydrolase [Phycisphaerales bacterium]|nr:MAG: alpha/beta hydrolase [Phycisphaerales bacterium]